MTECEVNTITDVTEQFCIMQFNDRRKNFKNYLFFAKEAWNEIFTNTLWSVQSTWLPVQKGDPYPYIILPKNVKLFLGLFREDDCRRLIAVSGADSYSTLPKPATKSCGCAVNCNCGNLCAEVNSFTYSTKEHEILGDTYIEKIWTELCPNGDIVEYREVPSLTDDNTVEVVTNQERLCAVTLKPCGCVDETPSNAEQLIKYCGCRSSICRSTEIYRPQPSECETVMQFDCDRINLIGQRVEQWYRADYQEKGASAKSLIPDFAKKAVWAGMDFYAKAFNPRVPPNITRAAKFYFKETQLDIVEYLNPIDFEFIYKLDSRQRQI